MQMRITVRPDVHFGEPCITNTRIPVRAVLELVRDDVPLDAIIHDYYPELSPEDVKACLQYAIDVVAAEEVHVAPVP